MCDNDTKMEPIKVFYNSACPVCNTGVSYQKDRMRNCDVEWADVHVERNSVDELDADLDFIRERLHVKDTNGNVRVGIDAFITLWEHSPGEQWKARVVKTPIIHGLAHVSYNTFARYLTRWNRARGSW